MIRTFWMEYRKKKTRAMSCHNYRIYIIQVVGHIVNSFTPLFKTNKNSTNFNSSSSGRVRIVHDFFLLLFESAWSCLIIRAISFTSFIQQVKYTTKTCGKTNANKWRWQFHPNIQRFCANKFHLNSDFSSRCQCCETTFWSYHHRYYEYFTTWCCFLLMFFSRYGYNFLNFFWCKNGNAGCESSSDDDDLPNNV